MNEKNTGSVCVDDQDNKTQELKDILNKVTSLTSVETDILQALVDLSRRLE
jgi:hypothetical protein